MLLLSCLNKDLVPPSKEPASILSSSFIYDNIDVELLNRNEESRLYQLTDSWSGKIENLVVHKIQKFSYEIDESNVLNLRETKRASFHGQYASLRQTLKKIHLVRVYGGKSKKMGYFLTDFIPLTRQGAIERLALLPSWGNSVNFVDIVEVAEGTQLWLGTVARQGYLPGGETQAVLAIPKYWQGDRLSYIESLYQNRVLKVLRTIVFHY